MNAQQERFITCPAGRRIVFHQVNPVMFEVSEEPFIQLSDGRSVGLGESQMMFFEGEPQRFFLCSQCISWAPRGCHVGLDSS